MKKIILFLTLLTLLVVFQNVSSTLSDLESLRQAAEQGDVAAQFQLGTIYYTGQDVPRDLTEAAKWYRKVAEQGFSAAQHNLGIMYSQGEGVPQDYEIAFGWYRKAAEQGDSRAQNNLGNLYRKGQGIPKNDEEAVKWFRKAAEQGYAVAQYNLGVAYNRGEGVFKDKNEAIKWYRKAAEQGYVEAQRELSYFEKTQPTVAENQSTTFPVNIPSETEVNTQPLQEATKESLPTEPVIEPTSIEPVEKQPEKLAVTTPIETPTPAITSTSSFNNNHQPTIIEPIEKQAEKFTVTEPIEASTPTLSSTPSFNNNRYPSVESVEKGIEGSMENEPTEETIKRDPVEKVEKMVATAPDSKSESQPTPPKLELRKYTISLSYARKKDKPFMNQLANHLKEKGYRVDRIGRTYTEKVYRPQWDIRYYYDRKAAEALKENIKAFLQNVEGVNAVDIRVRDFSYLLKQQIKIKRGRMEVWILNPY